MGPRAGLDRCGKSRPQRDSIPDGPARSQSLYRLSYRTHSFSGKELQYGGTVGSNDITLEEIKKTKISLLVRKFPLFFYF